ncbi:MAG: hypothetical protein RMJ53_10120 [Chitinophagales bacterium]|nr:hypothetical protein [Chitinophagales bacterium]MDW8274572.1 hypothetical protein [Chitinophagales bacterium]
MPEKVIKEIKAIYHQYAHLHHGDRLSMHTSSHSSNPEMLMDIYLKFLNYMGEYYDRYLTNYKFLYGKFFGKGKQREFIYADTPGMDIGR